MKLLYAALAFALVTTTATAGAPKILKVKATNDGTSWSFAVTVLHKDQGRDHFADSWTIYTETGQKLGTRILTHPHVNAQPFTRTLSGVKIPAGTEYVFILPHDNKHGDGPHFEVELKKPTAATADQM